ncbi:hypothetical protein PoB_000751000 [Plakobranchus ocellatus]|uniref:Uncharacterized protein n=1 Tax=Plakobranchus ocellatus TaxID=259542 RepID=A0AAV3YD85_9GAST|nr:hypothetical protein PoB_000751000 [Plakobranchus ocellatus]
MSDINNDPCFHSKKRKRKGPSEWTVNKRKKFTEMGLNYISQNGTEKPAKERSMRCNCKSKSTACSGLTEEERQEIFNYIWKLTWGEKRAFIQGVLEKCEPKRQYSKTETPPNHQRKPLLGITT